MGDTFTTVLPNGFYSGTSNIVLPVPNKTLFPAVYQEKSRLCYYASLCNSLEVNSSFYRVPMARTVEKWAADVPATFRFTFKLWKGITHNKGLIFNPADVNRFMQVISMTGTKAGCLLVQFPASIGVVYRYEFERLLSCLRNNDPLNLWNIAVEFRNRDWYRDDIYQLLETYSAGIVLHDMPASATPFETTGAPFIFLRFHGPEAGYRGSYTDAHLAEYDGYINDWLNDGKAVYAYFNNTLGAALQNLTTLNCFVNAG